MEFVLQDIAKMLISKFIVMVFNVSKNGPTPIDAFCAQISIICPDLQLPSRLVINVSRSVIILPHFVLTKIYPICNRKTRDFCISPMLFFIFSPLLLIEFFMSGIFSIEMKY